MKRMNHFYLVLIALCTSLTFITCGNDENEPTFTIDPILGPDGWVEATYLGTTLTDLESRNMSMRIDTTYNQAITLEKDSLGQLTLTYHDWTDHTGMHYGDFHIVPVRAITTTEGVAISGECTDSLYKAGQGYPATLIVEGNINGEQREANLTLNIHLAVSPAMTLKFTLSYEGIAN
ncbi:MAG: hypothetical protein IKY31_06705 [Bacteroidaceae bacterium]|nr:hypothetical protein [Bacteroidaceae bacterium]